MRVCVAGPLVGTDHVRAVQSAVLTAGHGLTLDWSRGPDVVFDDDDPSRGHVVVIGPIRHESVFFHHPAVQRVSTVDEWLTSLV